MSGSSVLLGKSPIAASADVQERAEPAGHDGKSYCRPGSRCGPEPDPTLVDRGGEAARGPRLWKRWGTRFAVDVWLAAPVTCPGRSGDIIFEHALLGGGRSTACRSADQVKGSSWSTRRSRRRTSATSKVWGGTASGRPSTVRFPMWLNVFAWNGAALGGEDRLAARECSH